MVFSDLSFLYIFLPLLLIFYYIIRNNKWRNVILVIFSLIFYAFGEIRYIPLLVGIVVINYLCSLAISSYDSKGKTTAKKLMLALAIVLNLGLLLFFKYIGLFEEIINLFTKTKVTLPQILLPLGISFFTFQSMSYTLDVYRKDVNVQKNFFKLLLYVSLFPQLIAGPIVRYRDISEQIDNRTVTLEKISDGAFRFAVGLGKKVLIANACDKVVNLLLDGKIESATVVSSWIGILFFALQIYFDFSGYSDMAIGLGKLFGFEFKENFNYPYISKNATEFWRRWHISLGSFFRDYLYIPLGGNRKYWIRNVLIVWFLTGMWHGANINFIIWGLYYGILLILEKKALNPLFSRCPKMLKNFLSYTYMIFITLFGWTLFYYTDNLWARIGVMFGSNGFISIYEMSVLGSNVILLAVGLILATPLMSFILKKISGKINEKYRYTVERIAKTVFIIAILALSTAMLAGNSYNPFLYFRF